MAPVKKTSESDMQAKGAFKEIVTIQPEVCKGISFKGRFSAFLERIHHQHGHQNSWMNGSEEQCFRV